MVKYILIVSDCLLSPDITNFSKQLYDSLIELYKNNKSQLSSILGLIYNIKTDFQILNKSKNKKLIYMLKYFIYYNTKIKMKLRNILM